jgi:pimeloyl-ACP methyl ester carboxylesterase
VALDHPDRVASLTLISTSPTAEEASDPDLPEISEELQASFAQEVSAPEWSDREAVIDYIVEGERPFAGSHLFDKAAVRAIGPRLPTPCGNLLQQMLQEANPTSSPLKQRSCSIM